MRSAPLPRIRTALTVLLALLLLTGCFDYSEEVWIYSDRSVRMRIDMGLSEVLAGLSGETSRDYREPTRTVHPSGAIEETYASGGMFHRTLDARYKSFAELNALYRELEASMAEAGPAGQAPQSVPFSIAIEQLPNGNYRFRHEVRNWTKPEQPPADDWGAELGQSMLETMLGDASLHFKLYAPRIVASNGEISADARSVEWKVPLKQLLKSTEPIQLEAEVKLPLLWLRAAVPAAAVVVGLLLLAVLFQLGRLHAKRQARGPSTAGEPASEAAPAAVDSVAESAPPE
jgi:hypothetical protein